MRNVVSKQVVALYPGGGLLQDDFFRKLKPNDPYYQRKEDDGLPRKTFFDSSIGMGSNDRKDNPFVGQHVSRDDGDYQPGLTSGYGEGPANDETGPGNKTEPTSPYYSAEMNESILDLTLSNPDKARIRESLKAIREQSQVSIPVRTKQKAV